MKRGHLLNTVCPKAFAGFIKDPVRDSKFRDIEWFDSQEEVITRDSPEDAYLFARDNADTDIPALQEKIESFNNARYAGEFARVVDSPKVSNVVGKQEKELEDALQLVSEYKNLSQLQERSIEAFKKMVDIQDLKQHNAELMLFQTKARLSDLE